MQTPWLIDKGDVVQNKSFSAPATGGPLNNLVHERINFRSVDSKDVHFFKCSFKYSLFEDCYFRNCKFEECDFTGATFRNSNLRNSTFEGSKFDYCRFSNTLVSHAILDRNMPGYENVAAELARSLRTNFSQIGDSKGVNRSITEELKATRTHLYKAAFSSENYYRRKYAGWSRGRVAIEFFWFRLMDFCWGHGESIIKLTITLVLFYGILTSYLLFEGSDFSDSFYDGFLIAAGVADPESPHLILTAFATFGRIALFGLFVTVLVRRFSRR